jgi:hypothetical protein
MIASPDPARRRSHWRSSEYRGGGRTRAWLACLPRRLKVTGNSGGVGGKEFVRSKVSPANVPCVGPARERSAERGRNGQHPRLGT